MAKTYKQSIRNFSLGRTDDLRSTDTRRFAHSSHFDVFSYDHKLVPRYSADTKEGGTPYSDVSVKPYRFLYAERGANGYALFALAEISAGRPIVLYWDNDASAWVAPTYGLSGTGITVSNDAFFDYKGYAYMWYGAVLMRYKLDATTAFTDTYQTVSSSATVFRCSQPVHFTTDDVAYLFTDNFVHKINDATWTEKVLTLPSDTTIIGAVEYQNYLVIAVNNLGKPGSTIFFWDRDSSLNDISYRYDHDNEKVYKIAVVENRIMLVTSGAYKLNVRRYDGAEFVTINQLDLGEEKLATSVSEVEQTAIVFDDKAFFSMTFTAKDASSRLGIWALDVNGKLSLDTVINGATSYQGLFYISGLLWVAHSSANMVRTNRTFSTTVSSIYETLLLGDASQNKKLVQVGVITEPLPTAGQIVLKYRLKDSGAWTTIYTHTTDGSYYHEAINIESTGVTLPEFKEIQFRVESIGGAVVTGIDFNYEDVPDGLTQ